MSFEGHHLKFCGIFKALPSDEMEIFSRGFFNGDAFNEMNSKMCKKEFPFEDETKLGQFYYIFSFLTDLGAIVNGKENPMV